MISYKQGDVMLVDFGFSEGTGYKRRPLLIISSNTYHNARQEVIVADITSNIKRILFGDTKIEQWKEGWLLYPSLVTTGIIRTIKTDIVGQKLGTLSERDFHEAQKIL